MPVPIQSRSDRATQYVDVKAWQICQTAGQPAVWVLVHDCARHSFIAAPPREQVRREVGGWFALMRRTRRDRRRVRIDGDDLTVEMPGGVTEQRDHHGKPQE